MNVPFKNLVKTQFIIIAMWFAVGMSLAFAPATAWAVNPTVTVTVVGGGTVSPNYNGQQLVIGQTYKLQAKPKSGFAFVGWTGSQVTDAEKITFVMAPGLAFTATFSDMKAPTVTIKTPPNKSTFTNAALQVTGVTKDNSTVAAVYYQLNEDGWVLASTATVWSNWWANIILDPGANSVQAYAVDTTGNVSKIDKITLTFNAVPGSLSGQTMVIRSNCVPDFSISFTNTTFSQSAANTNFVDGVGTYTFSKVNSTTGKLTVRYTAPPNTTSDGGTVYLQFADETSGLITNGDGSMSAFELSPATGLALASLGGADFILTSTNNDIQRILFFTSQPTILDNGNLNNVANPLVLSVSSAYAGNIGDRVSVLFSRIKTSSIATNTFVGTVIAATAGAATNTVTVLFDSSEFVTSQKTYAPMAGSLLSVLTYGYTNIVSGLTTSGAGTYDYATYSPAGALLNLTQTNESSAYVLTFDASGSSGTYYEEFTPAGGTPASDAGVFGLIAPPQIISQPQSTTVINGDNATFNVVASGSAPLAYQWQGGNINLADIGNISGSATPTLTLTAVSINDASINYRVIVDNSFGSVTSSVVNLTISTNSVVNTNSIPIP